jgi:hypothetical protein
MAGGLMSAAEQQEQERLRLQQNQRNIALGTGRYTADMSGLGQATAQSQANTAAAKAAAQQNLSQGAYEQQRQASQLNEFTRGGREQESQLQAAAEQRRLAMFSPYFDKFSNMYQNQQGGVAAGPQVQQIDFGGIGGAEQAAQDAAFARAKDKAGQIGRSATNALANVYGARGLSGSGMAVNQMGGVLNEQATQLGEVNREQAIQSANIARQRASELMSAQLAQRGQDVTQRGQNIEAARSQQQALLGLLGSFPGQITARY